MGPCPGKGLTDKSFEEILERIREVQELCGQPNYAQEATQLIAGRIQALIELLTSLGEEDGNDPEFVGVRTLCWFGVAMGIGGNIQKVLSMNDNPILFIAEGSEILEALSPSVQCFHTLVKLLPPNMTVATQERIRVPLSALHSRFVQDVKPFQELRSVMAKTQDLFKNCKSDENFVAAIHHFVDQSSLRATSSKNVITLHNVTEALHSLRVEEGVLAADLRSSQYLSEDPASRGKAIQHQSFLKGMIHRLESLESLLKAQGDSVMDRKEVFPDWAIDPLTNCVMAHPVTIQGRCQHVIDRTSFIAWRSQSRFESSAKGARCPVCKGPAYAGIPQPNQDLADAIRSLNSPTTFQHPCKPINDFTAAYQATQLHKTISMERWQQLISSSPSMRRFSSFGGAGGGQKQLTMPRRHSGR